MTKPQPQATPSTKNQPFPVLHCGICGWGFQTKEGKRWHLDTMHARPSAAVSA